MAAAGCQKSADRNRYDTGVKMKNAIKLVMALALVSVMGGLTVTKALSKDDDDRRGHADKGWHKGESRGDRDGRGDWRPVYQPVYREPYYYSQPVYVPPPVYYPPHQSPGISLFFPLDLR
jgi:hypothetical protein